MNSDTFGMPARRLAAVSAAALLATGPAVLGAAGGAHATEGHGGRAGAVVLRAGLDVSLLDRSVDVPLDVSLNEVRAPRSAEKTALSAEVAGVDRGRPFSVLRADVASADASVDAHRAEGRTELVNARVHLPGLPLLSLIEVEKVTSRARCETGRTPVAEADVPGRVTVLGKRVTLTAGGTTRVRVAGVGEVGLDLSKRSTTSRTAAASALELKVSVNPLKLNVADVKGTVTLAGASCETPEGGGEGDPRPSAPASARPGGHASPSPAAEGSGDAGVSTGSGTKEPKEPKETGVRAQGAARTEPVDSGDNLAQTGGSSATPYLAGGAAVLLAGGAGAVVMARSRRRRG